MYGVIEQQEAVGGSGPGSTTAINFLTGSYVVDGVTLTAADVVSKPERIGASGLEVLDNAADGMVEIIGDLLTLLLTSTWTVVIEWSDTGDEGYETRVLAMRNTAFDKVFHISRNVTDMEAYENASSTRTVIDHGPFGNGIHRVAVTHKQFELSLSIDGRAAETSTAEYSEALDLAAFGGDALDAFSYNGCFIRSLDLYVPAVDVSELPGLSA